jgi:hypothetical protein
MPSHDTQQNLLNLELSVAKRYFRILGRIPAGCAARLEALAIDVGQLEARWQQEVI